MRTVVSTWNDPPRQMPGRVASVVALRRGGCDQKLFWIERNPMSSPSWRPMMQTS